MPEQTIHLTALREALDSPKLEPAARRSATENEHAARFGALLVDLPYFEGFAGELVRHVLGMPPRSSAWGQRLHDGGAVSLLYSLIAVARETRDPAIAAAALGLASHAVIDRTIHPLVNALAKRYPFGKDHESSHREAEKFQSICFHESYFGKDVLGTSELGRHFGLEAASGDVLRAARRAFSLSFGSAPSARELSSFQRGYRLHVELLSSPLGRMLGAGRAREQARSQYMRGNWGDYATLFEQAVSSSLAVMNAAWTCIEAANSDESAATEQLARVLPPGTIDPDGGHAELERPYAVVGQALAQPAGC